MLLPYTLPKKVSIIRVNYKGTHRKDDLEKYREFCEAGFNDTHEFFTCTRAMLEKRDCLMIERGKRDEVMRYLSLDSVMDVSRVVKYSGLMMNELESGVEEITNVFVRIQSDITRMGYNFTDGCGRISRDLVVQLLPNANPVPSVLQIRAPGLKGVLVVDPTLEDRTVVFRKSMQKLNILKIQGEGRVEKLPIAVLNYSKPLLCRGLNMQVIYILLERGVNAKMISEKDCQYKNAVNHALVDIQAAFDFLYICGHDREFEELQNILSKTYSRKESLKSFWNRLKTLQASQIGKWRRGKQTNPPHSVRDDPDERLEDIDPERRVVLPIRKSNLLFGVCDHRGILEPGQCYAHVLLPNGKSEVLKGRVAIMRNPCYHPGDVLLVEAVDLDVFHSIHNAIVFSVKGERPAADVCSGGDLDGDRFLVIWDSDILQNMKPVATFDYRPHVVARCISQTVSKLGILTAKQSLKRRRANDEDADVISGASKTDLIDYLISHGSKDTIVGRIDALLLNFQKFEFQPNAKSILTRDELVCLLTALFAASVDSMGIDVDAMVHAVLKEINNSRTPNLSVFKMLHEECIRNTEATATFVKAYEKQASLLFSLFMDSVREGHEMWKSPVEKFIPSEVNNHYGLTARLMNARRLVHPQATKGVMASLLDNDFDLLRGCLDENTFMTCCQAVSGLEARIDSSLNACQAVGRIDCDTVLGRCYFV
ncbi:RNA dependent RNA polymerase-domain-containing protein [Obelidium mucronatum]|nr:RNA dependent RNA polymerase-domain-containing protein [Obelidium mucronatum]